MLRNKNLLCLLLLLNGFSTFATHIVGGEMNYTYIGNNQYIIRLTLYRDCYNGIPPFDNPASIGVFDGFNNLIQELLIPFTTSDTLPPTVNSPCFIPPVNICYERTSYYDTLTLPPGSQMFQLAYQRCCRNYTILNIVSPQSVGATYYASIPSSFFGTNSNPVFKNWPPSFICLGFPFIFDHSATDADGDSIYYDLCLPFDGADTTNPRPQPPNSPPYNPVTYQTPYGLSNLLGGVPLTIDHTTGLLQGTPNTVGQFLIGVCAYEFRNGILLSVTKRDFQLNVVPCPTLVVAALQNPQIVCGSNTVSFQNNSINAGSYFWDFGDTSTLADTSHLFSPSYNYPDTGTYVVKLIAYSSVNPGCADTAISQVTIRKDYQELILYKLDTCTNIYTFNDSLISTEGFPVSWQWNFGDGSSSPLQTPDHSFQGGNVYTVSLISTSDLGCKDTALITIPVNELINIKDKSIKKPICYKECNGIATLIVSGGYPPYIYSWDDPLNQHSSIADSLCSGIYNALVSDIHGCTVTSSVSLSDPDSIQTKVTATPAYCKGRCYGTATASASGGNGNFSYQWITLNENTATVLNLCPGTYQVNVSDSAGCKDSSFISIIYSDSVPYLVSVADPDTIYVGQSTQLSATPYQNVNYNWLPADGLSSPSSAVTMVSPVSSTKFITEITDRNGCTASDTVNVIVLDVYCREPFIFIPNAFSPNNDQVNDILSVKSNYIESMHLMIFDRWGEKVYESYDVKSGWDGKFKGVNVIPGVYGYYLEAECWNREKFIKKGNITVME